MVSKEDKLTVEEMPKLGKEEGKKRTKELDLLFGAICPDCGKLITVVVRGKPSEATAIIRHGGKPCAPAPPREFSPSQPPYDVPKEVKIRYLT